MGSVDLLSRGEEALATGEWDVAREVFEQAAADGSAEGESGLGRALWWLGDPDGAIDHRERAFAGFREIGENRKAAALAIWLAREHLAVYGNEAVANGWLARAERLLGDDPGSPERGWLEVAKARREVDPEQRARRAGIALALGRDTDDADLEVAALAELGLAYMELDKVGEGLDRLDEAMAAATGGEVDALQTVAEACCTLVAACERAGDSGRLEQWARIVSTFVERRGDLPLLGFCQTCNAEMLASTGRREEAERELLASVGAQRASGHRSRCVDPAVKLAEVRILQGRHEEARALLDGKEGLPESVLPAADLDVASGDTSLAIARLLRRLNQVGRDGLLSAQLLERLVVAQIAAGDLAAAADSAADLARVADGTGHPMLIAHARLASGRVGTAMGKYNVGDLEVATDRFTKLQMPLEASRSRFELAQALRDTQPEVAIEEARTALVLFDQLGATAEADRTAALLRELGTRGRTGPKDVGLLTKRETEVLHLLTEGLSNPEIAARLFISRKTAEHHVGNVLAKLHLENRSQAAAFALRYLDPDPAKK